MQLLPQITGNCITDCNPPTKQYAKIGKNHIISTRSKEIECESKA